MPKGFKLLQLSDDWMNIKEGYSLEIFNQYDIAKCTYFVIIITKGRYVAWWYSFDFSARQVLLGHLKFKSEMTDLGKHEGIPNSSGRCKFVTLYFERVEEVVATSTLPRPQQNLTRAIRWTASILPLALGDNAESARFLRICSPLSSLFFWTVKIGPFRAWNLITSCK